MPVPHIFTLVFFLLVAACVGSFLNVVIYRLPRGMSINKPSRSICPHCDCTIPWYDNVPVLSWFSLGATCRKCGQPIAMRYIVIELLNIILWIGMFCWYFVLDRRNGMDDLQTRWATYLLHCSLLSMLLAASAIDLEFYIIPLSLPWIAALLGVAVNGATGDANPTVPSADPTHVALAAGGLAGLVISCLLLVLGKLPQSYPEPTPDPDAGPDPDPDPNPDPDRNPTSLPGPESEPQPESHLEPPGESEPGPRLDPVSAPPPEADCPSASSEEAPDGAAEQRDPHEPEYNDRREVLKEILFLAPPVLLALLAVSVVPGDVWAKLAANRHASAVAGSIFGLLIGGGVIWAARIIFTLAFGREAMGLGDVHLMAGVGAVLGWPIPIVAFFAGPVLAIPCIVVARMFQFGREIPFGPWLSAGTLLAMLFHDEIVAYAGPGLEGFVLLLRSAL